MNFIHSTKYFLVLFCLKFRKIRKNIAAKRQEKSGNFCGFAAREKRNCRFAAEKEGEKKEMRRKRDRFLLLRNRGKTVSLQVFQITPYKF
jgi:hypothetical protein